MQRSFFDITPDELGLLGAEPAVDVLREMILAETSNLGIPITDADVPYAITTADGGIDAVIKAQPKHEGNGLIFAPMTSYQVKAGDFSLGSNAPSTIEALLMTPTACAARVKAKSDISGKSHKVEDISPRVRACLDAGGTFVTMLFGNDNIDMQEDATENAIRIFLTEIDPKYKDAKIKVWRQSRIATLLRRFPAVSLQIKNLADFQLLSHAQWADRREMRQEYLAAPDQEAAIKTMREAIRDDSQGTIHIRVIGEPGIGKTRLILETLRADDIRPNVLYADRGSKIIGSVISAINTAKDARIVLVVDECGPELRSQLGRDFGDRRGNLTILSIYQDAEDGDRTSDYRLMNVPLLPVEEIETIIKSYGVDGVYAKGWAEMCDGSPRVAHVVGQNLRDHPADPLKSDGTSMIWVRYLAQEEDRQSEEYRRRQLVMSSLALFKRFGWGPVVRAGAYEIFDLIISKLDSSISKAQFGNIIEQMAARKVLQGDHYLYITPRALQLKLWVDWWVQHGPAIDMNEIIPKLSREMQQWFGEMLEYANATPIAKQQVAKLLGPEGLYAKSDWLNTKEGGRFFFSLSLGDPASALRTLERTVGKMSRDELLEFSDGRRDVIHALENIALRGELFRPAAKLMLALAESENESWSNNATGVFEGLFSLGPGDVAPTSLDPAQRLPVLLDALKQGDTRIEIALKAFDHALELQSISRWGGDEPFKLAEPVKRWLPKTYGELFAAYKLYWTTLRKSLPGLPAVYKARGKRILLSSVREMLNIADLHEEVLDTVGELAKDTEFDGREVIEAITTVLRYDSAGLPAEVVSRLEAIRGGIVGTSFASRMRRYAGMDMLEDKFDSDGNDTDSTAADISRLVDEALAEPSCLNAELHWLVTEEAKNGFNFGYRLGQKDTGFKTWPDILKAWAAAGNGAHDFFLGGYLRAVNERDPATWEKIILGLAASEINLSDVPALIWRSGMTEAAAQLILHLAQEGKIRPRQFRLFSMGKSSAPLSEPMFKRWLDFLIQLGTFEGASTALDLASMSMHGGRKLSAEQIKAVLMQPILFERREDKNDVMLTHYWLQMARSLVKLDPSQEIDVLRAVLENIGNSSAVTARLGPDGERYLDSLVERHPGETWKMVSEMIKPPMDTRGFVLTRWLRGDQGFSGRNPGPMRHIKVEDIREWIEKDPETRASYVATMATKDFHAATWKGSLIREILCSYGDSEKVQGSVYSNYFTGGWSGPASAHYAQQINELNELRQIEDDPNALRWLNGAIKSIEGQLEEAKIEEEARGY